MFLYTHIHTHAGRQMVRPGWMAVTQLCYKDADDDPDSYIHTYIHTYKHTYRKTNGVPWMDGSHAATL